ncbi:MAG: arginase family protein [Bacteroidaceae bacterium]|nr:arginase family protein [Bacteroidaceae bacterium]
MVNSQRSIVNRQWSIVINFTHVYEAYNFMQGDEFKWVDCTQIEGTDCYCDQEAEQKLKELMAEQPLETIHWIDSGDYHYVSKLWIDRIDKPFTLLVMDHHPDMQRPMFDKLLSCGSWVRAVLEENPWLQKVILIGVDDKLLSEVEGFAGKVEVVSESELNRKPIEAIIQGLHISLPVYVSIDKDVMTPNECSTNWDQGSMSWQQLTALLDYLLKGEVLGIDICGEEPKILTECVYCLDSNINADYNESLYNYIKGK